MLNDCFKPIFESNKPLRSLHNSFLTLLYRFGLLFLLTLILAFKNVIVKVIKTDYMSLVLSCCVIAFIDPLLDSPVASIPFWILLFIEGKENA